MLYHSSRLGRGDNMPNGEFLRFESKDSPDERLKLELLRIDTLHSEDPEARAQREVAIADWLTSELPHLANIARVPPKQRARFGRAILNIVLAGWENTDTRQAASKLLSNNAALSRAMEALRTAKRALADLDERDRKALSWPIAEVEGGIDRFFEWVMGEVEVVQPLARRPGKRRPGRRRGTGAVRNWFFQVFVRDLLRAAKAWDGKLTLDQHESAGTLIKAIDLLKPSLPEGLVPNALPLKTMQRIKTRVAAERR